MQHSSSWEANRFAASQEIPRILWNPNVHYRVHKWPPSAPSWASSIQSIPQHITSWRSILILSSHLRLGLPSGLPLSGFPTKTPYTPLPSPIRATWPAHVICHDFITRTILGERYKSLSSSLCSFLRSPSTSSLLGPYILKHTQPTFLPQCQRSSFISIQNNKQNSSPLYLNLYIFGQQTGRQKN
jgi:hypothetical protein